MKKQLLLSAALLLSASAAMAQSGTFQLKGNFKNFGDTIVVYKGGGEKRDTLLLKKGKFAFTANLNAPKEYYFMKYIHGGQAMFGLPLVCVPGESAEIEYIDSNFTIKGSAFYKQYNVVDELKSDVNKELESCKKEFYSKLDDHANRDSMEKVYDEKLAVLQKAKEEKLMAYIAQHPNDEAATILIPEFEDWKQMQKAADLFSESVKNGRMKAYYQPIIDRTKKRAEMEEKAKKVQASGVEAPDFTLKDINGKDLSLSSLRGKYVVLDFWGSWCIWCIKGMPKMKEYYEKYKGKFEILGVDCNDTEAKWKAAVEKHQLPWLHVYNPKTSDMLNKYAIQGFPTKMVLGPDGKIVKTIVGEDPAFYTLLDDILK